MDEGETQEEAEARTQKKEELLLQVAAVKNKNKYNERRESLATKNLELATRNHELENITESLHARIAEMRREIEVYRTSPLIRLIFKIFYK